MAPSEEDRFAALQLSAAFAEEIGVRIPIREGTTPGKSIVLHRSGPVAALPVPGEVAGPDSREAYSLAITPEGVTLLSPTYST